MFYENQPQQVRFCSRTRTPIAEPTIELAWFPPDQQTHTFLLCTCRLHLVFIQWQTEAKCAKSLFSWRQPQSSRHRYKQEKVTADPEISCCLWNMWILVWVLATAETSGQGWWLISAVYIKSCKTCAVLLRNPTFRMLQIAATAKQVNFQCLFTALQEVHGEQNPPYISRASFLGSQEVCYSAPCFRSGRACLLLANCVAALHLNHPILFPGNFILMITWDTEVTCISCCVRLYVLKHEWRSWKTMYASAQTNKTPHFW